MNDLRFALSQLRKNPGFTAVAVLTLALGIGANLAVFTMLDDQFLRPRPIKHPENLVQIAPANASGRPSSLNFSWPYYNAIKKYQTVFTGMIALNQITASLQNANSNERINGLMVSANYFDFLDTHLRLGRGFVPGEDQPGAEPVAVISYRLWQEQFGGTPTVIGRLLKLNKHLFHIIGVAPPGFVGLGFSARDVWIPYSTRNIFGQNSLSVFARLRSGIGPSPAEQSLQHVVQAVTQSLHPPGYQHRPVPTVANNNADFARVALLPAGYGIVGPLITYESRGALSTLVGLVSFATLLVLLTAAANLASLLLARGLDRQRELATRVALGAPRSRLIRQLVVEGLLIVALGGLAALTLLNWYGKLVPALIPHLLLPFQRFPSFHADWRVVVFALVLTLLIGIAFSFPPALAATRLDLFSTLKNPYIRSGCQEGRWSMRKALVIAQVAGSFVLLSGVFLCLSAIRAELNRNIGFRAGPLIIVRADLSADGYTTNTAPVVCATLRRRLSHLRAIQSIGLIDSPPLAGVRGEYVTSSLNGHEGTEVEFPVVRVGPACFRALGIPLLEGREVTSADFQAHRHVALVNQAFIRRFWSDQNVLGKLLRLGDRNYQIVGIVQDARLEDVRQAPLPTVFASLDPVYWSLHPTFILRAAAHSTALLQAISTTLKRIIHRRQAGSVHALRQVIQRTLEAQRNVLHLLAELAAVALGLTALGTYGLMAYLVKQRTHEIAIRVAVGAQKVTVVSLILKWGFRLAIVGTLVGLPAAIGAGLFLQHLVLGIRPLDVADFITAASTLSLAILLAAWLPAHRAANRDPMLALRSCE